MIRTENVTKKYNNFTAVKDLNLNVKKGEIYAFLGPNGAGKTTTILMILGIIKPTQGKIKLFDKDLKKNYYDIKQRIGVAFEEKNLYYEMTAEEYLTFFAEIYGVKEKTAMVEKVLQNLNLCGKKSEKLRNYSKGMRQKIEVARALIPNPEILIFDEPASGLDPYGISEIRNVILAEKKKGKTILISSHILSEIEKICDRVGIINHGVLLIEDSMDNIKNRVTDFIEIEIELNRPIENNLITKLCSLDYIKDVISEGNTIIIKVNNDKDYREKISQMIFQEKNYIIGMKKKEMSLEDAFITITEGNIKLLTEGD